MPVNIVNPPVAKEFKEVPPNQEVSLFEKKLSLLDLEVEIKNLKTNVFLGKGSLFPQQALFKPAPNEKRNNLSKRLG